MTVKESAIGVVLIGALMAGGGVARANGRIRARISLLMAHYATR